MASTFSPSLRLELVGDGDQSGIWGQTTNNNLGTLVEQAIAGVITINILDANYTLTNFNGVADEARNAVITITGTLSQQRNIIAPLADKVFTIRNATTGGSGFPIQIIGSSGTGVVIPNGATASVYCDGTNFLPLSTGSAGNFSVSGNLAVTGTTTLTGALSGSTAAFSGAITSVSPAFSGTPTATTAAAADNSTRIATTAFVIANGFPSGGIIMWSGSIASIPTGFALCNGSSGTPDLRDRFIVGAGSTYAVNATGGSASVTPSGSITGSTGGTAITENQMPKHFHRTWGPPPVYPGGTVPGVDSPGTSYPGRGNFNGGTPDDGAADYGTWSVGGDSASGSTGTGTGAAAAHSHSLSAGFSGNSQDNRPPYYALAYIMKL
jgi:hypothetical protein